MAIAPKQRGKRPKFIGSQFSLSVYDITANEMSDTCHSHLVANGNSLNFIGSKDQPLLILMVGIQKAI